MKILHTIRELQDRRALDTARAQLAQGHEVTLILLHDAVLDRIDFPGPVLACADDVAARGGGPPVAGYPLADYARIVAVIFDHDRVISW